MDIEWFRRLTTGRPRPPLDNLANADAGQVLALGLVRLAAEPYVGSSKGRLLRWHLGLAH